MSVSSNRSLPPLAGAPPRFGPWQTVRSWLGIGSPADWAFKQLCQSSALVVILLVGLIVALLALQAWPAVRTLGTSLVVGIDWDPTHDQFGGLAFVYGSVVTALLAMLLAVPLGVGTATFLAEVAPAWLKRGGSFLVELLAAIPSVVYGFWGIAFLAPNVQKMFTLVGGPPIGGKGLLSAGLILAIMVVPYVAAVSYDVCQAVPRAQREGALALGATRWQTIWGVVLPYARPGILGGCFLALGRAIGETMAVTMLIGNTAVIESLPFGRGNTIPSLLAQELPSSNSYLEDSALIELSLLLFVLTILMNVLARVLIWRVGRARGGSSLLVRPPHPQPPSPEGRGEKEPTLSPGGRGQGEGARAEALADGAATAEQREPFPHRGSEPLPDNSRRAGLVNRLMIGGDWPVNAVGLVLLGILALLATMIVFRVEDPDLRARLFFLVVLAAGAVGLVTLGVLGLCLVITCVPLFLILGYITYRGLGSVSWQFFVNLPRPQGETGGGLANALVGSGILVGLATLLALPAGILAAIFLAEYRASRLTPVVRFFGELLGGVPSIVIGTFVYAFVRLFIQAGLLQPREQYSGWAGAFALAVMMVPVVMRASEEALKLVPQTLRSASYALGAHQWQSVLRVTVPAALPAIITGAFLAIARIAGETAPLLMTAFGNERWAFSPSDRMGFLPLYIYRYAMSGDPLWEDQAWAAALVLLAFIMLLNVGIRFLTGKRVILASRAE